MSSRYTAANAMRYALPMSVDEVIGRNVHQIMWDKRIQHRPVYEAMGVTRGSLHKKMRGEVAWLARDIEAAAQVLEVDPGVLFVPAPRIGGVPDRVTDGELRSMLDLAA